jgi:hypothetical protein
MPRTFVPQLTEPVITLCRSIQPSNSPDYVQVKPGIGAKAVDCFVNVQKQVEAEGGRMQYGWAIWQCSQYYLEAEHHAVYEPVSGSPWVDITPPLLPTINRILFLPDENAVYDFNTDQLRDNIRMPLTDDARVRELCDLSSERTSILNSVPGFGQIRLSGHRARRMDYIEKRRAVLLVELQRDHERNVGRNDPCPCGSGKKDKKCHGVG